MAAGNYVNCLRLIGLFLFAAVFDQGCGAGKTDKLSTSVEPISRATRVNESHFKYLTLKQWTDEVLRFDEAKTRSAVSHPQLIDLLSVNKIDYQELDQTIRLYVDRLVQGPLAQKDNWLDNTIPAPEFYHTQSFGNDVQSEIDAERIYFGQKLFIPYDSTLVIMGDFHGSIHSLMRNLWRLVESGYLDNNFKIVKDKTHFIFTGDFVDRGRYSAETLYTLLRLKLASFDNVHLVRGNHETKTISSQFGLVDELYAKYGNLVGKRLFKDIYDLYRFLPVVLFVGAHDATPRNLMHFSHGGFSYNAHTNQLIHSPRRLIASDKDIFFELIPYPKHLGYMWTDFTQADHSRVNISRGFDDPENGVVVAGRHAFEQYINDVNSIAGINMVGLFRGHQDQAFGFKLLFKDNPSQPVLADLALRNVIYPEGPFHWRHVVRDPQEVSMARQTGIRITLYRPVYTFTTAAEGQGVPFDMYGVLKLAREPNNYRLEVHEIPLSGRVLDRSYVTISSKIASEDDNIGVSWAQHGPGRCLLLP